MTPLLALALVLPQDTLRIGPGVHSGPLVIERPAVVVGAPGAVIRGDGRGSVLIVKARGAVVRGLRLEHSGRDPDRYDAGVQVRADSVTLEDLVIRDVLFGVYLEQVRGVALRRLDIAGLPGLPESQRGDGVTFYSSRQIVAESLRISHMRDGMYFSYSDSVRVTGSRVSQVRFGLHYMYSHHNRFERNVFSDNAAGAVIMYSNGLVVVDNVFAWNAGSRSYGLVLQTSTDAEVRRNVFVGNGVGVFFDNVVRGTFSDNLVAGNWLGLRLFTNSEATRVTGNAIVGNTFDASGGAAPGAYRFCAGGRGNYWGAAGADGYDLDGDGVLDVPHAAGSPLAELALDRAGLRLFLGSPAARALDWAERTFPVFDVAGVVDTCPLAVPPVVASLTDLPAAPAAARRGAGTQHAAGAVTLFAGLLLLARRPRRRERRS